MRFLDTAHREGVLWRNGGVYQFRHMRIQEMLEQTGQSRGGTS